MKVRITLSALVLGLISITIQYPSAYAQSDRVIFAVIGDYGLAGQAEADVANLVKSWNPDFIVTTGDNNYPDGASETIDQNIGQYYHEYIFPYKGTFGSGGTTKRFFPSLGNHDWGVNSGKALFDYFSIRNQQSYYEFVQGPVHFFVLNSNREEPDGVSPTSPQGKWLKKSLAASISAFNVVVFHHPPYSSGRHGSNIYMQWPFKEWGADVVLSGHDHTYERLIVEGMPYFVNGIGGGELYYFNAPLPESQSRFNQDFGAMRVEATNTYMKFQTITRTGLLMDEYTIGQNIPIVTAITAINQSPANASVLNFQVSFSESVTGVDVSDFTLSTNLIGAAIENVSGFGNTYTVSVSSGNGDGTLRLDLTDNDSIMNGQGNSLGGPGLGNGTFTNGQTYTVDKTAPMVVSITRNSPTPTNASNVEFSVVFSEPVNGVDLADFGLATSAGAQTVHITGSGSSYLVSIATGAGDDAALRLDFMMNGSVADLAGNISIAGFTNGETYSIDRSAPYVTSIVRADPGNASSVDFIVSFSEAVSGVDGSDFSVSTINGAAIANVIGSGDAYTVSLSLSPGNDVVKLDLLDDDSIVDHAGNNLGGAGVGNGNFTNGEAVSISQYAPSVTSILRGGSSPTNAASVDFIVTFSEPVTSVDATDFVVTGGINAFVLKIEDVNPFYVITVDTGFSECNLKLDLVDDDSIRNSKGISLGGEGLGNANFTSGEAFFMDRTAPRVTSITRAGRNPAIDSSVDFIVTFSEPVLGVDVSDFVVTTPNLNAFIADLQNANPFYVVTVNGGAGAGTVRLDLIDNLSIVDLAGNRLNDGSGNGSFSAGESFAMAKIPVNFPAPVIVNSNRYTLTNNPTPSFSWNTVRNARAYELFLALDPGFSQIILTRTVDGTSFITDTPLIDGTYYLQVRAYNSDLNPGRFSKPFAFTLDATPPPPPVLVSPPNQSNSPNRPLLQWQSLGNLVQYEVQLDNNSWFTNPKFMGVTTKTSLRTSLLPRGVTYYWRLRAKDKAGNWSAWSESFSFFIP